MPGALKRGLRVRAGERFGEGPRGEFLRSSCGSFPFGELRVFAETTESPATLVSKSPDWEGPL